MPDAVFTSLLCRSKDTYKEILNVIPAMRSIPIVSSWRLNERHYGSLVGLSKEEAGRKLGEEKVMEWRR
jgi:2,3-bisphosphoglycerate-dependent phosphoglycerate mutase